MFESKHILSPNNLGFKHFVSKQYEKKKKEKRKEKRKEKKKEKRKEKRKKKNGVFSGHYVIASSLLPDMEKGTDTRILSAEIS